MSIEAEPTALPWWSLHGKEGPRHVPCALHLVPLQPEEWNRHGGSQVGAARLQGHLCCFAEIPPAYFVILLYLEGFLKRQARRSTVKLLPWQSGAPRSCWGGRLQSLPGTWSPSYIYHGHETLLAVAGEMALD